MCLYLQSLTQINRFVVVGRPLRHRMAWADYQQILSAMRKSEASSRRVSFNTDTTVRVYAQWHGTPSPARVSPPNRAIFPSEEDYNAMSPLQKRLIETANRRSSVISTPPRRSMSRRPSLGDHTRSPTKNSVPKSGPQPTFVEDEDVDMDIDDDAQTQLPAEPSQSSDMSIVTNAPSGLQSQRPSMGRVDDDDADMSIVDDSMEIRNMMWAPRDSQITPHFPRLSTRSGLSDMSVAVTEHPTILSSPAEAEGHRVGHDFVVPLGHRVPRTDTDGNVLSPTQAEKDKIAALAALAALGGENDSDGENEDEDSAPVVPLQTKSGISVENVSQHAQSPIRSLPPEETTTSTMSLSDTTGELAQRAGVEATVNITAFRQSLLRPPPFSPVRPATIARPSGIPVPKSPARTSKEFPKHPVPDPATPSTASSRPGSTTKKLQMTESVTASPAPPPPYPRKRSLPVPPLASTPNKRRAISVDPSPSKARNAVIINAFSKSSFRPTSKSVQSKSTISQPIAIKRNPFLDEPEADSATRQLEPSSASVAVPAPHVHASTKDAPDASPHEISNPPYSTTTEKLPMGPRAGHRAQTNVTQTTLDLPVTRAVQSTPPAPQITISSAPVSRPSTTPFSNAPSRKGRRLSAAFRARRSSVIPGKLQQPLAVPDPATEAEEANASPIVVSQENPPGTTEVEPSPAQIAEDGVAKSIADELHLSDTQSTLATSSQDIGSSVSVQSVDK